MDIKKRLIEIDKERFSLEMEKRRLIAEEKAIAEQAPLLQQLQEFEEAKKAMVSELRSKFPAFILPIMLRSNVINSIGIPAYSPHFNDGDECVYSVNTDCLYVNGEYYEELDLSDEDEKNLKDISAILDKIPDETYRDVFGNHVLITVHKDGRLEVSDYDHE